MTIIAVSRIGLAAAASFMMAILPIGMAAQAQSGSPRLLGSYGKWDALTVTNAANGKVCYMISKPTKWTASRKGVSRGDIYLTVTHRPKFDVRQEVNATVGYPLRVGSEVSARVDGKTAFRLFTEGRGAWTYQPRDDEQMVQQMKRGITLIVKGRSERGTNTTDTYSLRGFTAAFNAIDKACP